MKQFTTIILCAVLIIGCATGNRATYNTLASLGKAVDIAERQYMDGVLAGTYATNDFPRIQASYSAFQGAYKLTVISMMGKTNAPPTEELARQGAQLISDIQAAVKKGK